MLFLQRLAQLLPKAAYRKMGLFMASDPSDRYWLFFQGLREEQWKGEAEAAAFFHYASPSEKGFRRLKAGLRERLTVALLYTAPAQAVESARLLPFLSLQQQWALANVFWHLEEVDLFQKVAKKALEAAIAQHQFALGWQLAVQLQQTCTGRLLAWVEAQRSLCWAQLLAEHQLLTVSIAYKRGIELPLPTDSDAMEPPATAYGRHNELALQWGYLQRVQGLLDSPCLNSVVEVGERAMQAEPFEPATRSFFMEEKAKALYINGQSAAAIECLESAAAQFRRGQRWWLQNRLLLAQIQLLEGNYQAVSQLWVAHWQPSAREGLSAKDQERWLLLAGYLELAARWGLWSPEREDAVRFRLKTLLNDLPLHSMDKKGDNLSVWFLSLHFMLLEYQSGALVEERLFNKLEALRKYRSRHLVKSPLSPAAAAFVQLWLKLGKYWMNWTAFHEAVAPLLPELHRRACMFEAPHRVIPYPVQWEALLQCLNRMPPPK